MLLDRPFFVLATQNPIEQEGTYPLPVTQLDRFLFNITIDYPSAEEEFRILIRTTSKYDARLKTAFERSEIATLLDIAKRIEAGPEALEYASRIVRNTRPSASAAPSFTKESVAWGGGPRATQALIAGAKAMALMAGRPHVSREDIERLAVPTLRHRILLRYHAQAEGIQPEDIVARAIEAARPQSQVR